MGILKFLAFLVTASVLIGYSTNNSALAESLEISEPANAQEKSSLSSSSKDTSLTTCNQLKYAKVNELIDEDSTRKGVIQIVADATEYDQEKKTFLGIGNAVVIIGGQDSKLEADSILYDQTNEMINARGNVKIIRKKEVTTGSAFEFKVTSEEYLITDPDAILDGTKIIARVTQHDTHDLKAKIPFISGVNFRRSAGALQDQAALLTSNTALAKLYRTAIQTIRQQPSEGRVEEQATASTVNRFALGNDRYGVKSYIFGGASAGHYSTGQSRILGQYGPQVDARLNRFHFKTGCTQAAIRGSSPFYFDQYLQGLSSANFADDTKVAKWLRKGGGYGYILPLVTAYTNPLTAAFGPDDFKLLINRDVLKKVNRFGFDILYGRPGPFDNLGNFPCRGVGWRNGLPVLEKPCTPVLAPGVSNGELPWVF